MPEENSSDPAADAESQAKTTWKLPFQDTTFKGHEKEVKVEDGTDIYKPAATETAGDGNKASGWFQPTIDTGPVYRHNWSERSGYTGALGKNNEINVKAFSGQASVTAGDVTVDTKNGVGSVTVVDAKIKGKVAEVKDSDVVSTLKSLAGLKIDSPTVAPQAARVGDETSHGTPLSPGHGSPNVFIGCQPAWRTNIDFHACPRSHPPHVGGVVEKGALTVFINGQMACRQGDRVYESGGGPNPIAQGCPTVFVGQPSRRRQNTSVEATGTFGDAEAYAKLKADYNAKKGQGQVAAEVGAKVSLLSGSVEAARRFHIPFTHYSLTLKGSAEGDLGTIGAKAGLAAKINEVDPETGKKKLFTLHGGTYVGLGAGFGLGGDASVERDD